MNQEKRLKMNREIKFRVWEIPSEKYIIDIDSLFKNPSVKPLKFLSGNDPCFIVEKFTGFQDCNEKDIYEGDDLGDWTEVDGHPMQSRQKVFWNQPTGSWHLDNSYKQDQTSSTELWLELQDFKYEVLKPEL